jgi:hypothetical protein
MIPKRQETSRRAPVAGPRQPKQEVLLENYTFRLSAEESKKFLTDDGSSPSQELIELARRNADLLR